MSIIGDIGSGIGILEKIKKFLIKPHIYVNNNLLKYSKQIIVSNAENDNGILLNPEKFNIYLWTIHIKNKYPLISQTASNLYASLYIHDLQNNVQLLWKPTYDLPNIYFPAANITENYRDEYKKRLPHDYCETFLQRNNIKNLIDIPKGSEREIFFLFTTEEFKDKAFLISPSRDSTQWKEGIFFQCFNDIPLTIPIPNKSRIDLLLQSTNRKEYRFELDIKSYKKINLNPVPFFK